MALLCLAIVGKENEPLYLRDFQKGDSIDPASTSEQEECFGFGRAPTALNDSLSLEQEFKMHASIDQLEERLNEESSRAGMTKWIGKLCPMEDTMIYGYVTPTHIKFLAMVESNFSIRESDLKVVFARTHDLFIQYTLNPFSKLRQRIDSPRFDAGVTEAVRSYNGVKSS